MKRALIRLSCLGTACFLSGCGDHLGKYEVEKVELSGQRPQGGEPAPVGQPYSQYLRVEISSQFDLSAANTGAGLYTDADFCPIKNPDRLIAFGPYATDGTAVEGWMRQTDFSPNRRTGRYHYAIYIVSSSPRRKLFANSSDFIPEYDVLAQKEAICLRLFVPGYNITPSESDTIRIPAKMFVKLGP